MKPPANAQIRELFKMHSEALLLYARQWLGAAQAEDVVQEVFLKLLAGGRLPDEPRTWLFRCVRNASISAWRSSRRRDRREQATAQESTAWFVPRPEDRLDAQTAQQALAHLPPIQREILTLRIWSGLTLAQIAEVTGIAVSAVHGHYRTGLAAMRERLEQPCKNPPQ
jgi:RNA polymerase sigma-70 factor (ECF subfamily)